MTAPEDPAGGDGATKGVAPEDPVAPLRDWITLWHSEMSALLTDREVAESLRRGVDAWAAGALALLGPPPAATGAAGSDAAAARSDPPADARGGPDADPGRGSPGRAGPAAPAGAAAAAVPPGAADADGLADELRRLRRRVAELERRLGGLPPRS